MKSSSLFRHTVRDSGLKFAVPLSNYISTRKGSFMGMQCSTRGQAFVDLIQVAMRQGTMQEHSHMHVLRHRGEWDPGPPELRSHGQTTML